MLQLSELWIYPIKSLAGISLKQSQVTARGLEFDRRWMLVDDEGIFINQRNYPELALFQIKIEDDFLVVTHPNNLELNVRILLSQKNSNSKTNVMVWEDTVEAVIIEESVSNWFSQILGFSVRLVYMPDESQRKVDPDFAITSDDITSFSDGFPFLIIGQSSLDDLNSRLVDVVTIQRFRPNFVFTGGEAYEEESWKEFSIDRLLFQGVKPSGRCAMITVNPEKGVFSGKEPLFTLSQYKKAGNKVIFGQNAIAKENGSLQVGDTIKLLSKK
ncbi:MOSC N-terminal beta barrel domain-containing protein [Flavobacterium ovatum]|uniref:MOSC domain-containing protein n=1 Tax=Flavobacterium ovatum TaxID=1928857 RepID=UPI00344C20D4